MNGRFQSFASAHVNERTVLYKCGVQCAKRIAFDIQVAAQVRLESLRVLTKLRGKACGENVLRQRRDRGNVRRKVSVYEDQEASRIRNTVGVDLRAKSEKLLPLRTCRGLKFGFGHRRNVGEAPVLVLQGGETELCEAGDAGVAQGREPFGLAGGEIVVPESLNNPRFVGFVSLRHDFYSNRTVILSWNGWLCK